jgi:arylsulfatase A-like enzyme
MHYPFWYPEQYEKYTPILNDNSEILTLAFPELAKRLANRYRNSTLFTDEVLSDFILRLKTEGLLENTLVVIMGDHGEMLGEDGKLFHANGSEFIQYNTPFVILGADVLPGKVTKVTSHVDIIPTLGSLLGFTASGAYGKDFLGNIDGGAVTFDLSGPGRITFRDRKFASMFYWSGGLSWILSCGADCRIDEKLEQYYTPQNLGISFSIAREHGRQLQELLTR